jgi:hypothetical protein
MWENGALVELNEVTAPGSPYLLYANDINDAGEIAGEAFDPASGTAPAYVAVPRSGDSSTAARSAAIVEAASKQAGCDRVPAPDTRKPP